MKRITRNTFIALAVGILNLCGSIPAHGETFPIRPNDRRAIDRLFTEYSEGPEMLRQIAMTGKSIRVVRGETLGISCNRETDAEYCNQITAWICHRAMQWRMDAQAEQDAAGINFTNDILNKSLLGPEIAEDQLYELASKTLTGEGLPRGRRPADTWGPMVEQLRHTVRHRDMATADNRAALAGDAKGAELAHWDRITAQINLLHEVVMIPPAKQQATEAGERFDSMVRVMQADLMLGFGRLPKFSVAISQDNKVYVTFEIATSAGETGQVTAELTPRGFGPFNGPTLIPVAIRPDQPIRLPVKDFSASLACTLGAQNSESLGPIDARAKLVQLAGQDPFIAFDIEKGKVNGQTLIPRERQQPGAAFHIVTGPHPEDRIHPAALIAHAPKLPDDDAGPGNGGGRVKPGADRQQGRNH